MDVAANIVGAIDICLTRGKQLHQLCKTFKNAEKELAERALRIEACWLRVRCQLDYMTGQFVNLMNDRLKENFSEIITKLMEKLDHCSSKIEPYNSMIDDSASIRPLARSATQQWPTKAKFARSKDSLDQAIEDLETWQRIFDPSWFLIITSATPAAFDSISARFGEKSLIRTFPSVSGMRVPLPSTTTRTLKSDHTTFLDSGVLQFGETLDSHLPFSRVRIGYRKDKRYLLDSAECPQSRDSKSYAKDARSLASKLSKADPFFFNILACKGVIKEEPKFTFVFKFPNHLSDPSSLRSLLLAGTVPVSLSERFQVAKDLVKSVLYVHYYEFVHKNIRPEEIWLFRHGTRADARVSTFLLGFGDFRHEDAHTGNCGDSNWARNLYRHPQRQGTSPSMKYTMQHDIYSVGVCLLEIGLWQSFVEYKKMTDVASASSLFTSLLDSEKFYDTSESQSILVKLAQTCLTCLDPGNVDFGDSRQFEDKDGLLIHGRLSDIQV
ncbi:hypothetical protein FKW77_007221 [Venturia effusa]|uniref:Protein kinase domain-containing protein n=1 Tax=Venturia effusa TaxID=50376 RepID=A0A517LJ40_9PEZI|nr:hypothetical protein FKW77_007221 [Venturia effusa]